MSSNPEQFSQGRCVPPRLTLGPHTLPSPLTSVLAPPLPTGDKIAAHDEALKIPMTCLPGAAAAAAAKKIMIERRYDATNYDSLPVSLSTHLTISLQYNVL